MSAHPNAGLPNELGGYDLTPDELAREVGDWAERGLVNIVGGCCGTTPDHIRALVEAVAGAAPRVPPAHPPITRLAGLEPLNIAPDSLFVNVGERTNVTGSPRFARLVRDGDFEAALGIARSQVENGAQAIDVNMDEGLLDSEACMVRFLNLIASEPDIARVPVMIDSSRWDVIEAGLKCVQGKGVVNSISLKNGPAEFLDQARRARRYGAAVVVMAFDEEGQADTLKRRIAVCERAYELLVREADFPPEDIVFDPNIFAVATGIEEHRSYAADFIEAARLVKERLPGALVSGGLSNVSFAFRGNNPVREAMHAAFLYHAIRAGLDMAIVNAGQLTVFDEVEPELRERVEDVILDRRPDAGERLLAIAERYAGGERAEARRGGSRSGAPGRWRSESSMPSSPGSRITSRSRHRGSEAGGGPPPRRHRGPPDGGHERGRRPVRGGPDVPPPGGQVGPGDEEGGRVPHPLARGGGARGRSLRGSNPKDGSGGFSGRAGRIVLATAKGDVHDIGKNIVGVVLQCNGFEVIDLGVMVPVERILSVAREERCDLVGVSGLITPSLDEMVHIASEMTRLGFRLPLLIGGATTSKVHTAVKIDPRYEHGVIHVPDASRAAGVATSLVSDERRPAFVAETRSAYGRLRRQRAAPAAHPAGEPARASAREPPRHRLDRLFPAPTLLSRPTGARGLPPFRPRRADRLVAVLPHLGARRAVSPDPRRPGGRGGGSLALRGRPGHARPDRRRALAGSPRRLRLLPRPHRRRGRHRGPRARCERGRMGRRSPSSGPFASRWRAPRAGRTLPSPTTSPRARAGSRTTWGRSRSRPASEPRSGRPPSRPGTTTTPASS